MSELGLGLAALGRPGYINLGHGADLSGLTDREAMERSAHDVLDEAYASGIRHFDVARSYGLAEEFLASWLEVRDIRPADVVVSSKWGYAYTAGWRVDAERHEVKDLSKDTFRRQLAESLELLGSHLRIYQIRSAAQQNATTPDALALAAALAQPWADVVLSGATTREMLRSNLEATQLSFDAGELDDLREEPHDYWSTRAALPWN